MPARNRVWSANLPGVVPGRFGDAGLAEDFALDGLGDVSAVRVGDAYLQRAALHEGVTPSLVGALKAETSEPADQFPPREGPHP